MVKKEEQETKNFQASEDLTMSVEIPTKENTVLNNNLLKINNMKTNLETTNVNATVNESSIACDMSGFTDYRTNRAKAKQKSRNNAHAFKRLYNAIHEEAEIEETETGEENEKNVWIKIEPHTHTSRKCNYVWVIIRTKKGVHKFTLYLNESIFLVLLTYISTGKWLNIDCNANNGIAEYHKRYPNFPLSLMTMESNKGKKFDHIEDKSYSKYDYGMITYKYQNNEELKRFVESIW